MRAAIVILVVAGSSVIVTGSSASATSCAYDPDDPPLTIHQMIRRGTTGKPRFDHLFLGRVRAVRDLDDEPGGDAIATVTVRAHPVGFAPHRTRVHTWVNPPGMGGAVDITLEAGRRYAVVAHRLGDGSFRNDGICGQTRRISAGTMRRLLALARRS